MSGLAKSFGDHQVLTSIDFEVHAGSVTVLIGPSGSGKTTVLRSLNSLEIPDRGHVRIDEVDLDFSQSVAKRQLADLRAQSGMVFQSHNLFPHMTVLENIIEGPTVVQRRPRGDVVSDARRLLELVGSRRRRTSTPTSSPAGSSSASASPAPSHCGRS